MNIIFLTIARVSGIETSGIYTDLMRKFRDEGHNVYIVTPYERQFGKSTKLEKIDGVSILGVKTLNLQKTNIIEKGVGQILLESQFCCAIRKFLSEVKFDLILYSTPPITFGNVVKMLKKRNRKAISYLLLKDIFPQNAVDLNMFTAKGLLYRWFRRKEKQMYYMSDYIGCMSRANVDFIKRHNPDIPDAKLEINPNSISVGNGFCVDKLEVRDKYKLPKDKPIFLYGGNLGKPQGIDFLIQILDSNKDRQDCFFLIVGNGTEFYKLENWFCSVSPANALLIKALPKNDYDILAASCDIGLIFLDNRFTIPNYPSRLLSYLNNKMPIIAATDVNTDIGKDAELNGYGRWCVSGDIGTFNGIIDFYVKHPDESKLMGEQGHRYLKQNFSVEVSYNLIMKHLRDV